jgi:hypothetical protein
MLEVMQVDDLTTRSDDEFVATAVNLVGDTDARMALRGRIIEASDTLFEHQPVISAFAEFLGRAVQKVATG